MRHTRLARAVSGILTSRLGISTATAASLVRQHPSLLAADPDGLKLTCSRLHGVLSRHPPWLAALHSAPPAHVRACLYYGPKEFQHLEFLQSAGLQGSCGPCHPILQDRPNFAAEYAGFGRWLLQRRQRAREQREKDASQAAAVADTMMATLAQASEGRDASAPQRGSPAASEDSAAAGALSIMDEASISTLSSIDAWDMGAAGGVFDWVKESDASISRSAEGGLRPGVSSSTTKRPQAPPAQVLLPPSSSEMMTQRGGNRGRNGDDMSPQESFGVMDKEVKAATVMIEAYAVPGSAASMPASSVAANAAPKSPQDPSVTNAGTLLLRRADAAAGDSLPLPDAAAVLSDGELGRAAGRVAGGGGARSGRPAKPKRKGGRNSSAAATPTSPLDFNDNGGGGQMAVGT